MGSSRATKAILALCALWMHCTRFADAFLCDLGDPYGLRGNNALVKCHLDVEVFGSATAICPRRVNDTEYVWHPQPTSDDYSHINTYVSENGKLASAALSDVIRSESENPFIWFESNQRETELHLDLSIHKLFAITERQFLFICGPRDLVFSNTLQRHLDRLSVSQPDTLTWSPVTPLTQEIAKIGHGLGILFLHRGDTHLPLQGCGSRPSPLFATDEVTVDPVTGTRSCVVDSMSRLPIGFVCEGTIVPDDCMRSLLDKNGGVATAPRPYPYRGFGIHRPWVVARYFNELALPPINGECRCIDPQTGRVKARIEIRPKTEYVCDVTNMILRNHLRQIRGHWCSVVLHPGSTLTIRFPAEDVDTESSDEDAQPGMPPQKRPKYLFETGFTPKDLTTVRQVASVYDDIYDEVLYHEAIAGDALEWDASKISRGEVKLTFHENKPLTSLGGQNSFSFHWALKPINKYVFKSIFATVNVSFAFTHYYKLVGCDSRTESVFDPDMSRTYCSVQSMGNDIGATYECLYHITWDGWQAGIYCRPDEELLPDNCESTGYDLYSNRIVPSPASVHNVTPRPIGGFQVFDVDLNDDSPISYACICVDESGYETSRLVLAHNHNEDHTYQVLREENTRTLLPYLLLPWREAESLGEGVVSTKSLMIYHVPQKSIALQLGKTMLMTCGIGFVASLEVGELPNYRATVDRISTTWLPENVEEFYYTVKHTTRGPELIRKKYQDSLTTTQSALETVYLPYSKSLGYSKLTIKTRRSGILISKDPLHQKYVPMTFVCGKTPEPADLSVVTRNASTSDTSAQPLPSVMRLSMGYTWNVVEVAVETTDPYMQGCGVTYASTELFKPETPKLYKAHGQLKFGCKIDLQAAKEAAFYCPAPYVLDPPNCFSQVYMDGEGRNLSDLSKSLVSSHSNHFVILQFDDSLVGPGETLRQAPPLECRCVTVKGVFLSTIQIENYYAKR
ncbi:hypothetical protein, conserved [Babesia ovata]|uniref:6-Cys domain-containing protein n=1 Tax=Babesia ovata TaxID=189622 RepID=A0A2H6K8J7_9APIC|nr:uncharacterized protein BOVATA_008090 [Babesia ovata]GBE59316.1 hypothetical protein, conserved [Babesia ovata]